MFKIHQTPVKMSKVKVTRSMKLLHKNIKHMPQTSSDRESIPVLYKNIKFEVTGVNGRVRLLTRSFEIAVYAHSQLKYAYSSFNE